MLRGRDIGVRADALKHHGKSEILTDTLKETGYLYNRVYYVSFRTFHERVDSNKSKNEETVSVLIYDPDHRILLCV